MVGHEYEFCAEMPCTSIALEWDLLTAQHKDTLDEDVLNVAAEKL